jgi:hypothetical protein
MVTDTGGSLLAARMAGILGFVIAGFVLMLLGFLLAWGGNGAERYAEAAMSPMWGVNSCEGVLLACGFWALMGAGACLSDVGLFKLMFRATMAVHYGGVMWLICAKGLPHDLNVMWLAFYLGAQLVMWMVHWKLGGSSWGRIGRKKVIDKNACWHCGYDLRGSPASRECPECGGRRLGGFSREV